MKRGNGVEAHRLSGGGIQEMDNLRSLRQFLAEKGLEIIVVAVSIPLVLAALAVWLANRPAFMLLLGTAFLMLYLIFISIRDFRERRRRPPDIGQLAAFQVPRRGVIFTLGLHSNKPNSVVHIVLEQLKPEVIGFLGTPKTDEANTVGNLCSGLSLQKTQCKSEVWEPAEIEEGKIKTGMVIDWMLKQGLGKREIVLDLTGGTVAMSVAAFMAAEERRIDCQYIYSEFDKIKNQFIPGSQKPILITSYAEWAESVSS
jgi:CRISPR-associated protein (Cas_Cas02710)